MIAAARPSCRIIPRPPLRPVRRRGLRRRSARPSRSEAAPLHWDASAQGGVMKRFLGARNITGNAGFGPMAQLEGHVALLPLIRVGAYLGHDISPMPDAIAARDLTWFGLHVKLMSPFP